VKRKDYGEAGLPMGPNVWGERETRRKMLRYTLALLPVTLLPAALGEVGLGYAVAAALLGLWFLAHVRRICRPEATAAQTWGAYRVSLLYLALLFTALAIDPLVIGGAR
jgi:heme o synthase